jgi:signal transduction histidine kinase
MSMPQVAHKINALRSWRHSLALLSPPAAALLYIFVVGNLMEQRRRSTDMVDATYEVLLNMRVLRNALAEAESGQRGYLLTGDSSHFEPYTQARHKAAATYVQVASNLPQDLVTLAKWDRLNDLVRSRFAILEVPIQAMDTDGFYTARDSMAALPGREIMDEARSLFRELEAELMAQLRLEDARQDRLSKVVFIVLLVGAFLLGLISYSTARLFQSLAGEMGRLNSTLAEANADLESKSAALAASNDLLLRANDELEQRRAEAERANRTKTDFLAAMSHELRTPLNAIIGYIDLLELGIYGPVTEKQAEIYPRVRRSSQHLLSLITDILQYAKVRAGRLQVAREAVPIAHIACEINEALPTLLDGRSLEFHPLGAVPDVFVQGDRNRIRQVLLNLISNAIKYTPNGGRVEVELQAEQSRVDFVVKDTGPGIPPEKMAAIFDPFVQLARSAGGDLNDGVGLGLPISFELATAMDGELKAYSRVGEGSVFILTLPRAFEA